MPSRYRSRDRWRPTKRRSKAQQKQLAQLNSRAQGAKENSPPVIPASPPASGELPSETNSPLARSSGPIQCLKEKVSDLKKQCYNTLRREKRAKATAEESRKKARESERVSADHARTVSKLQAQLVQAKERNERLAKAKKALQQRVARTPVQHERAVARSRAHLTPLLGQRALAHMETTNDANEGVLGTLRISARRAPRMSLDQFNTRIQYKKNKTGSYIKDKLTQKTRQYLRKQARIDSSNGAEKKRRLAQAAYDQQTAKRNKANAERKREKRLAAARKLNELTPILVVPNLAKMRVAEIDLQIRWHRAFDPDVPRAKDLPSRKEEKLTVLRAAVERYLRGEAVPTGSNTATHAAGTSSVDINSEEAATVGEKGFSVGPGDCETGGVDGDEDDEIIY